MNKLNKILLMYLSIFGLYLCSSHVACAENATSNKINPARQLNIRITKDNFTDFRESLILNIKDERIQLDKVFFSNTNFMLTSKPNIEIISSLREVPTFNTAFKAKITNEENIPNIYNINLSSELNDKTPIYSVNIKQKSSINNNYTNFSVLQLLEKSKNAYRKNQKTEAQFYLDQAAIKAGKNSWNLAEIADSYEKINFQAKAAKTWEKAVAINPNRIELLYSYSLFLCRNNQSAKANKYLTKIISINPQFMLAYYNLGNIYFKNSKYIDAVKAYSIAISINPYCEDAFYNLALSLEALNKKSLAIKYYKECLKLNPHDVQVKNSLKRLKVLK